MKNRRPHRPLLALALLALLLVLAHPRAARADTKQYSIPEASFEVWLANDGTAEVEETWKVSYTKGDFTRFYKEIFTGSSIEAEERFSDLSVEKV